jgi:carotenoid cleavage dioxygenase-like enzyme
LVGGVCCALAPASPRSILLPPTHPPAAQQDGLGTANTALAFHAGRLLALHEGDLPYQLRIACSGLVETLGRAAYE